jgi:hypothetical protein
VQEERNKSAIVKHLVTVDELKIRKIIILCVFAAIVCGKINENIT